MSQDEAPIPHPDSSSSFLGGGGGQGEMAGDESIVIKLRSSILAWRIPWTEEPGGLHTVHGGHKASYTTELLTVS